MGGNSGSEWFVLFWSECHRVSGVRYFIVLWYLASVDPLEYVDAFDVAVTLEESGELVHAGGIPSIAYFFVRVVDEIFVGRHFVQVAIPYRPSGTRHVVGERIAEAGCTTGTLEGFGFALVGIERR